MKEKSVFERAGWLPMHRFRCSKCGYYAQEDITYCPQCIVPPKYRAKYPRESHVILRETTVNGRVVKREEHPVVWPVGAAIPKKNLP